MPLSFIVPYLDVRRIQTLKQGDQAFGSRTRVKVVKTGCSFSANGVRFTVWQGISQAGGELLDWALETGPVTKSGSWYAAGSVKLGQGREAARAYLDANQDLGDELRRGYLNSAHGKEAELRLAA